MGKIIALSGVDNSGKTTQSKLLLSYWKGKKKKVVVTEFAFGYYLLKPIIGFLRKSTKSPSAGPVRRNKNPIFKLWFMLAFVDIWIGYLLYLRRLKTKYDVVLCDRYYTDIWANLLYYGYISKFFYERLINFLPKADLSIFLQVEPKIGHKRINDEFLLPYYLKQTKIYNDLPKLIKCKVINSNKQPNQVHKKIVKAIKEEV